MMSLHDKIKKRIPFISFLNSYLDLGGLGAAKTFLHFHFKRSAEHRAVGQSEAGTDLHRAALLPAVDGGETGDVLVERWRRREHLMEVGRAWTDETICEQNIKTRTFPMHERHERFC